MNTSLSGIGGGVMGLKHAAGPVTTSLDLVVCPECGAVAKVEWHDDVASTDGPVELVKIRCLQGHGFLMLGASLQSL